VCVRAAALGGGIVLPAVYQGTGGGHVSYPWTIMMSSETEISAQLVQTLRRLQEFGLRVAVLFTGHFADEQLSMIDDIERRWNRDLNNSMRVVATGINRCDVSPIPADHAGAFETSVLFALWPDHVQEERLPELSESPSIDPDGDVTGDHRHDPTHPLWGIFGADPRGFDRAGATSLLDVLVQWLSVKANSHLPQGSR
jgi:creatinine amidohydrolase